MLRPDHLFPHDLTNQHHQEGTLKLMGHMCFPMQHSQHPWNVNLLARLTLLVMYMFVWGCPSAYITGRNPWAMQLS